jgi:hypothetical protein
MPSKSCGAGPLTKTRPPAGGVTVVRTRPQFAAEKEGEKTVLKRLASLLVAGAAAAAVALTAVPAHAAGTWTVTGSPGGTLSGAAGVTTLTDGTVVLKCVSSTATGTIVNGVYATGTNIAQITGITFTTCTGPLGLKFTVTQSGVWALNAVNYAAGVTQGTITNVTAGLSGPGCTATVTGSVAGSYTNSTATLFVDPSLNTALGTQLTISGVSGCFNLIHNGDHPTFNGSYVLTPNTIAITSP